MRRITQLLLVLALATLLVLHWMLDARRAEVVAQGRRATVHATIKQSFLQTVSNGSGSILSQNIVEVSDQFNLHDPVVDPFCINVPSDSLYTAHGRVQWATLVQSGTRALNLYVRRNGEYILLGGAFLNVGASDEFPPRQETTVPGVELKVGDCLFAHVHQTNALGAQGTIGVVLKALSLLEE